MPNLKKNDRTRIDEILTKVHPCNETELSYAICKLCIDFLRDREMGLNTLNQIMGAITIAQQEFYNRIVERYIEHKIRENGDIFQEIIRIKNI